MKMPDTREQTAFRAESTDRPFVSAIVLAAGMSKRMGSLKQLMEVGDRSLVEHTLRTVTDSDVSETILVLGYQSEKICEALTRNGVGPKAKVVINDSYAEGMSTSIKAGLQSLATEADAALIVLADQPLLNPGLINRLIDEYRHEHSPITVPIYKGFRGNPVLVDRALFGEMMNISGDIGCRSLFGLHSESIRTVLTDDIGILVDIDTAEDLQRFSAMREFGIEATFNQLRLEDRLVGQKAPDERRPTAHNVAKLLIIGGDTVATTLARLGKLLAFHVTLIDPFISNHDIEVDDVVRELDVRKTGVSAESYIVIASRGKYDEDALTQALETEARYIGIVGSKKRVAELIQRLRSRGTREENLGRVRSPAGLEIHASTPEEIALSILAEIVSIHRFSEQETRTPR